MELSAHLGIPGLFDDSCGVCSESLATGDRYLVVYGDRDSKAADCEQTGPFTVTPSTGRFTPRGNVDRRPENLGLDWLHRLDCPTCRDAPEAALFHVACLNFFTDRLRQFSSPGANPNVLDFLWAARVWQSPWRDVAHHLTLDHFRERPHSLPSPAQWAALGVPQMRGLPYELVFMIWETSSNAFLWRPEAITKTARRLATLPPSQRVAQTIRLSRLSSWKRQSEPILLDEPAGPSSVVRMAVDSLGIQSLDRVPLTDVWGPRLKPFSRFNDKAFAILTREHGSQWPGYPKFHFKYGLARLRIRPNQARCGRDAPNIWDTPNLPSIGPSEWNYLRLHRPLRFFSADLTSAEITGLTFISTNGILTAVHVHTPSEPSAMATVNRLAPWVQPSEIWDYCPISAIKSHLDPTLATAVSTTRRRDGRYWPNTMLTKVLQNFGNGLALNARAPICRLFWGYGLPSQHQVRAVMKTFVDSRGVEQVQDLIAVSPWEKSSFTELLTVSMHIASLENVTRTQVFSDADGLCHGIIFDYADGTKQAVGSCRIGAVRPVVTDMPGLINVMNTPSGDSWMVLDGPFATWREPEPRFGVSFTKQGEPSPGLGNALWFPGRPESPLIGGWTENPETFDDPCLYMQEDWGGSSSYQTGDFDTTTLDTNDIPPDQDDSNCIDGDDDAPSSSDTSDHDNSANGDDSPTDDDEEVYVYPDPPDIIYNDRRPRRWKSYKMERYLIFPTREYAGKIQAFDVKIRDIYLPT